MPWIDELIGWCERTRQDAIQRLSAFESGKCKLFDGDADVSKEAMVRYRATIDDMDLMIARAQEHRGGQA